MFPIFDPNLVQNDILFEYGGSMYNVLVFLEHNMRTRHVVYKLEKN